MNTDNNNYAYEAGYLSGLLKSFSYDNIPGIKITNEKLFEEFLKNELAKAQKKL